MVTWLSVSRGSIVMRCVVKQGESGLCRQLSLFVSPYHAPMRMIHSMNYGDGDGKQIWVVLSWQEQERRSFKSPDRSDSTDRFSCSFSYFIGQLFTYFSKDADVVAHELTHGKRFVRRLDQTEQIDLTHICAHFSTKALRKGRAI